MKCTSAKYSSSTISGANWVPASLQRILWLPNRDDLIVKPLPEPSSYHRKGRCSRDIVIPYASAIASLLIVYVSMRSPGVADVVSVIGTCGRDYTSSLAGQVTVELEVYISRLKLRLLSV
ncbi:hypothetical protein CY34DRAFT_325684 [Suillus luteus UH-Slu-Lm8-n1]|uniref:Uncharacterized protein n=1 Tax=Suillus luteus UH-Slu-Lm8-n1 TaxID=930992 RepID=A0A0D0B703_9AGAM|nr:hypothetical protein CY34DRAFT_325684 [Suillus luteus UH-Slu-Lm8-n1]